MLIGIACPIAIGVPGPGEIVRRAPGKGRDGRQARALVRDALPRAGAAPDRAAVPRIV